MNRICLDNVDHITAYWLAMKLAFSRCVRYEAIQNPAETEFRIFRTVDS